MNKKDIEQRLTEAEQNIKDSQKEIKRLKELLDSKENNKKLPFIWRSDEDYYYNDENGTSMISDNCDDFDNYHYFIGDYFASEEQAEAHRRYLQAVAAWNRLAGKYPSGVICISIDKELIPSYSSILRRVDTVENCRKITEQFVNEGYKISDLFLYAAEERK